jgi:AsmA protein
MQKDSSMKSLGKILGLASLGLLLTIVALGFALTHLFDPNDYKDEINQLVRDKLNLELTLNGEIGWSLFPWLGLQLTDATLASASTPDKPFANLRLLGFSVRVLPLLRKEVQMSDIRVDGLSLDLQRDEKGHGNWEDIGHPAPSPGEAAAPVAPESSAGQAQGNGFHPVRLDIDSLIVNAAQVNYHDAQKGQQFSAESIQLTTGAVHEGASVPIKLSAFVGSAQPMLRAHGELQGALRFDRALKRYQLEDARLSGEVSGQPFNGQTLTYTLQGQILVDLAAQVAEWNSLKLSANQLRALGELKVRDLQSAPKLSGGLSVAQFNVREFLAGLGQKLPSLSYDKSLSQFELVTQLSGTGNSLLLSDLAVKLDDTTFTGELGVTDFSKQALHVRLKGDQLNLDNYLPQPHPNAPDTDAPRRAEVRETLANAGQHGSTALPNVPTQHAWSGNDILPIAALRKLTAQTTLSLAQLTLRKHFFDNVNLKASAEQGALRLDYLQGRLNHGGVTVTADADVRPAVPVLNLHGQIEALPVELFLESEQRPAPLRGELTLSGDLNSSGNSLKTWVDTLNGSADFTVRDGVLLDANIDQPLCRAIATLNRKPLSDATYGKDTPFERLQGSLKIVNGVAHNPDLEVRIPGLRLNAAGDVDLRVLGLDYRVGIIVEGDQRDMPDPACQVNRRYAQVSWPLHCRGPLELGAKSCRLDQQALQTVAGKLASEQINEKLEEKLGDRVSPELKNVLKGLLKK